MLAFRERALSHDEGRGDLATIWSIISETWQVTALMAPYLLLGFLVAGMLSVWVSPRWLEAHLGGRGFGPVWKAALFGVPLPLCSCGVIPVGASLRRNGASRAATTAFLLSTPQTGVDSIAVTYSILGPLLAVYRPLAALLTGLLGGGLVQAFAGEDESRDRWQADQHQLQRPQGFWNKSRAALSYGLVDLPRDIGRALLIGVVIAGVIAGVIPQDYLASYLGSGALSILVMMAVGIPLYVCATASVPIAAGFIHLGVSPGAALAFLIAGPATNAAAITTVWRVLGRRTAGIYLATVALSALGSGLLLDWFAPWVADALPAFGAIHHVHEAAGWFEHFMGVILVLVLAYSLWSGRRVSCGCETASTNFSTDDDGTEGARERIVLDVQGMNCGHCSKSVHSALDDMAGVSEVAVDLGAGRASIAGSGLDAAALVAAVNELGYKATLREN